MSDKSFRFALRYPNGEWVQIDDASGGYPTPVKEVADCKLWRDKGEVERYWEMFKNNDFRLYEVRIGAEQVTKSWPV